MKVTIICVGKLKEKYLKAGIDEYSKRLGRFCKFNIVEVADEKAPEKLSLIEMDNVKRKEGEKILGKIKAKDFVYCLAIEGSQKDSIEFAKEIESLKLNGKSEITFVIGGSLGLSDDVLKRADSLLSFGKFTLPHQLMRLVLTEQIYRQFMINLNAPYHK